ncbi:hypothetical protein [Nannocystis sp.]|uniref:hypothetical protein n=1 Tax=Nannocystis sp. TaxID=1962667 RepID=UPI0025E0595A|nr:hypothetical protein [Nannocystis sp.]MBK7830439.1 hypothetical protein [Nannocystis sp.]
MRRSLWLSGALCVLACELQTREPSPASVPARVVTAPSAGSPIDPAVFAAAVRAGVRQPDPNQGLYEVDAFLVALAVEDLASGRPSLNLSPTPAGGPIGYAISGVREGSVYAALGLLDGDVIEAINGAPLDAPERGLAALAGSERGVQLQISRAGVGMTRELRIVGGLAWSQVLARLDASGQGGVAPPAPRPGFELPVLEDMPVAPAGKGDPPVVASSRRPGDAAYRPSTGASPSSPASSPASSSGSPGAVQCAGDGSCTVARRDFDAMVADPDQLARQVQVTPSGAGYRLLGIRAGSQVSQLGFRNGDVLLSVNGTRLDDQLGLLGLYAGLDSTRSYNISYQRGGVKHSRTIRLRD